MTQQTHGMPELKYSEEAFRDMYKALKELVAFHHSAINRQKAREALAKAEGK